MHYAALDAFVLIKIYHELKRQIDWVPSTFITKQEEAKSESQES